MLLLITTCLDYLCTNYKRAVLIVHNIHLLCPCFTNSHILQIRYYKFLFCMVYRMETVYRLNHLLGRIMSSVFQSSFLSCLICLCYVGFLYYLEGSALLVCFLKLGLFYKSCICSRNSHASVFTKFRTAMNSALKCCHCWDLMSLISGGVELSSLGFLHLIFSLKWFLPLFIPLGISDKNVYLLCFRDIVNFNPQTFTQECSSDTFPLCSILRL